VGIPDVSNALSVSTNTSKIHLDSTTSTYLEYTPEIGIFFLKKNYFNNLFLK
jgi:hypothetical protein